MFACKRGDLQRGLTAAVALQPGGRGFESHPLHTAYALPPDIYRASRSSAACGMTDSPRRP